MDIGRPFGKNELGLNDRRMYVVTGDEFIVDTQKSLDISLADSLDAVVVRNQVIKFDELKNYIETTGYNIRNEEDGLLIAAHQYAEALGGKPVSRDHVTHIFYTGSLFVGDTYGTDGDFQKSREDIEKERLDSFDDQDVTFDEPGDMPF